MATYLRCWQSTVESRGEINRRNNPIASKWYGDQESLLRVTGVNSFEQFEQIITTPDGTRIKFFDCRDYNHTPDSDPAGRPILTYAPDPYIVHFKGLSKRIMFQYAEQFIGMRFQHDRKAPGGVRIFLGR